jgi:gamma-glutamyltranspeptidase/glutathione hydrolase
MWVPELGVFLNNRADGFTDGVNATGAAKRPIHTLAPMMLEVSDGCWLALATPGADGQVQTLLQVLIQMRGGAGLSKAIKAPRWRTQDGVLLVERSHEQKNTLVSKGHRITECTDGAEVFGAVVAAGVDDGNVCSFADWRRQTVAGGV